MNEFNFRVANAAPRASGFEIGQNVGDTKTTHIYSYKTKYINGKSTGQKTNVDWDMESSIPSWVSVKYAFEGNDCKVTFTTPAKGQMPVWEPGQRRIPRREAPPAAA